MRRIRVPFRTSPSRARTRPFRLWPAPAAVASAILVLSGTGCGYLDQNGQSKNQTLSLLAENGFPKLEDLRPALPPSLTADVGLKTRDGGLPEVPTGLPGADVLDRIDDAAFSNALGEAKALSVQGLSELRRVEALYQNFAEPLARLMEAPELFARATPSGSTGAGGAMLPLFASSQALTHGLRLEAARSDFFRELFSAASFAVSLPQVEGFPAYLVLNAPRDTDGVNIEALWKTEAGFETGLALGLRLTSAGDDALEIAFAPKRMGGLVKSWKKDSCADDVFSVRMERTAHDKARAMTLRAWECPKTRNAASAFTLGQAGDGVVTLGGAFAQTFDTSKLSGLRASLGARQGVLVQAAIKGKGAAANAGGNAGPYIAAAAAVVDEKGFALDTQKALSEFGVAQALTRYFASRYREKKSDENSVAHYTCDSSAIGTVVMAASETMASLCSGNSNVDSEALLEGFGAVRREVDSANVLVQAIPGYATARRVVGGMFDVLSVRNTMFFGQGSGISYKASPSAGHTAAEAARKGVNGIRLSELGKPPEGVLAKFRTVQSVPTVSFGATQGSLAGFVSTQCAGVLKSAGQSAGRADGQTGAACSP